MTREEDALETGPLAKLEQAAGKVRSIELQAEQGCTSQVRRVSTETGTYILKSATDSRYREWLRVEAERLRRNTGEALLPIPKFAAFHEETDGSHLLMSCEKGTTLTAALKAAPPEEKKALLRSFGRFLHRFHERPPVESLAHDGDWLEERLAAARLYLERGQSEGDGKLLDELVRNRFAPVRQTMIHGDCTADNVMVHDGEVYLFIDVSGMTIGDPRYDEALAIGRFVDAPELLEPFYEGYVRYRISEAELRYHEGLYEFF
ncbi:phosphotransferase [Paenibacillus soyae]|uniref:Phosphotransferase n=1 Tax=Paenibacillus soyae TaxID=2969249 RepID=A0A9X2MUP9_9BACL|nr:phosphotransferase [Paenibacillus soyae]MCR2806672.1 phosphotransferase [Paenibacillus soyae]